MTEVLSQDNIESLLTSIEDMQAMDFDVEDDVGGSISERNVKLYDFRHPDRFSKEQMRTIEIMHETFSRLLTNNLSTQLRTPVDVHIASVHQITYEEFTRTIPTPTLFAVIDMQPFNGSAILEIDPTISFAIVERLFGGEGNLVINREMTEIEQAVAENIIEIMLGYLRVAWRKIVNLRPHLVQIETNPQLAQVVPPNEMMLMILFNCRIDNAEGMMNIAIPYITIDPIVSKLSAHTWYASSTSGGKAPLLDKYLQANISELEVDIHAILGKSVLSIGQVLELQVGDIIALHDYKYKDPVSIFVEDEKKFKAIPGVLKNRKAIKIVEVLDNEDTTISHKETESDLDNKLEDF